METTGCVKDTFYEDRYKQVKDAIFIGDDTHAGGMGLADMMLERLFDETLDCEGVLRRIGQKYNHQKELIKQGGLFPLRITENTTFSKTHYLLVDNDNKVLYQAEQENRHTATRLVCINTGMKKRENYEKTVQMDSGHCRSHDDSFLRRCCRNT